MFFRKKRLEEDLQRIKEANLPQEKSDNENKPSDDVKLEKGDILAITLAIISLILPYILAFLVVMGGVMLAMRFFWG